MGSIKASVKKVAQSCPLLKNFAGREYKLLNGITKDMKGLEIGPSINPLAPKREGYNVDIVDHLDREGLVKIYSEHGENINNIEEVDYVWKGGSYSDLIQKSNYYDYIIASHVIEHGTDFLGFLIDCSKLMTEGGRIKLAVPDKRFCFDHFRDCTGLREILDDHFRPSSLQTPAYVADYVLNIVKRDEQFSWKRPLVFDKSGRHTKYNKYKNVHTKDYLALCVRESGEEGKYLDIHRYVFTPASFMLLIYDLKALDYIDLEIDEIYDTFGAEFIVSLKKSPKSFEPDFNYRKKLISKKKREDMC